jgi:hypothetical protein
LAATVTKPRILIGGLGMGYTLRAALRVAPAAAHITVAELNPVVVRWCKAPGPLAQLTHNATADRRVKVEIANVARMIERAKPASLDCIMLDLYEGPYGATQRREDPFFGQRALANTHLALAPDGVFAVWAEDRDAGFTKRLERAGFSSRYHILGQGGRQHVVYVAKRESMARSRSAAGAVHDGDAAAGPKRSSYADRKAPVVDRDYKSRPLTKAERRASKTSPPR